MESLISMTWVYHSQGHVLFSRRSVEMIIEYFEKPVLLYIETYSTQTYWVNSNLDNSILQQCCKCIFLYGTRSIFALISSSCSSKALIIHWRFAVGQSWSAISNKRACHSLLVKMLHYYDSVFHPLISKVHLENIGQVSTILYEAEPLLHWDIFTSYMLPGLTYNGWSNGILTDL